MTIQTIPEPTIPTTPAAARYRAHLIWEKEGRPDGRDAEFWLRAEKELVGERQVDPPMLDCRQTPSETYASIRH